MDKHKLIFAVDGTSFNKVDHVGVRKKVQSQLALFDRSGIESRLEEYSWKDGLPTIEADEDTTVLYFRRIGASYRVARKLMGMKKRHPGLRILMEIPIYPFKDERREKVGIKSRINETLGTLMWKKCLDRIVVISNDMDRLYGVPVISVNNGIDYDDMRVRTTAQMDSINLIAVSGCFFWHGYDRLIKGLGEYYSVQRDKDVNLYIVGEGDCSAEYREISDRYGLTDTHVYFCGIRSGEELDEVFDKCDLAVDCLGAHRKNNFYSSSLKSREYVAKGLPIVSSLKFDIENEKTHRWFLSLPADESDINVSEIVDYYRSIYDREDPEHKQQIADTIRDAFREYCDINKTFEGVIDYIKN